MIGNDEHASARGDVSLPVHLQIEQSRRENARDDLEAFPQERTLEHVIN
jgi:hypothetical protein